MPINTSGPIVLVEDDVDDSDLFIEIFHSLNVPNKITLFRKADKALDFIMKTSDQPFVIICDINLPGINGFELRERIQENEVLRKKSIPFLFLSTNASPETVNKAYDLTVQGYFKKPSSYEEIRSMFKMILDYWKICRHPNSSYLE